MDKIINITSAAVCGVCGFLWGQADGFLYALMAFMCIDYISGVIVACMCHELSSKVGFRGLAKKCMILMLVVVGHLLDAHVLGGGSVCRSAVIGFYIANEGISILENCGAIGIPLPKKLLDVLKQLKDKEENND